MLIYDRVRVFRQGRHHLRPRPKEIRKNEGRGKKTSPVQTLFSFPGKKHHITITRTTRGRKEREKEGGDERAVSKQISGLWLKRHVRRDSIRIFFPGI